MKEECPADLLGNIIANFHTKVKFLLMRVLKNKYIIDLRTVL